MMASPVTSAPSANCQSIKLNQSIQQILRVGCAAQPSKLDIKDAYWIVPVYTQMTGLSWVCNGEGTTMCMDTRLPFRLRSAPKIFTALADIVQWLIIDRGVDFCIHYLDDYLFVESPSV